MDEKSHVDKWKMFKNFLHNELGISKADIQEWIRESVKEEVRALLNGQSGSFDPSAELRAEARKMLSGTYGGNGSLVQAVGAELAKGLIVNAKGKGE